MILIAAMSKERVIGRGEGMPWSVPEEYQHFLDTIRDQTVIMGRRSYEIFGADLTSAHDVVVTRGGGPFDGAIVVSGLEEAIRVARSFGKEVYVAGGASIYSQTIGKARGMYLSYIKGEFQGDAHFPEIPHTDWEIVRREDRGAYEFVEYRRRQEAGRPANG